MWQKIIKLLITFLLISSLNVVTNGFANAEVRVNPDNSNEVIMAVMDFREYQKVAEENALLYEKVEYWQQKYESAPHLDHVIWSFVIGLAIGIAI